MRIVDLTMPIHDAMPTYPSECHPVVQVEPLGVVGSHGRNTCRLVLGSHTGTHVDAPRHFLPDAPGVDELPLDVLVGPAAVLDVTPVGELACITAEDLVAALGGRAAERLVLRTDWSSRWGTDAYYTLSPHLSREAARWVAESGVRLLAMDVPSPDDPREGSGAPTDSPNHKLLMEAGVVLVEYLTGLDRLRSADIEIAALPLRVRGADGAPARCIAIERDQ